MTIVTQVRHVSTVFLEPMLRLDRLSVMIALLAGPILTRALQPRVHRVPGVDTTLLLHEWGVVTSVLPVYMPQRTGTTL